MFRRKGRDPFICELFFRCCQSVSDRKDSRIKYSDDIASVSFVYDFSLARHHLLRLREPYVLTSLDMIYRHSRVKLTGTDPHERDPVPVGFIHICLDLKYKG